MRLPWLFPRESTNGQRIGIEPVRDGLGLSVKRFIQPVVEKHCAETNHGKLRRNRPIRFDINNDKTHKESIASVQPLQRTVKINEPALKLCFKSLIEQCAELYTRLHATRNQVATLQYRFWR